MLIMGHGKDDYILVTFQIPEGLLRFKYRKQKKAADYLVLLLPINKCYT